MASSTMIPGGSLPSFSAFSNRIISSKLSAFLIISCNFLRSLSVSFRRDNLDADAPEVLLAAAVTSNVLDLRPIICIAPLTRRNFLPCGISSHRRSQLCRRVRLSKQLLGLVPLRILDLDVIKEPHRGTPPDDPVPIVLRHDRTRQCYQSSLDRLCTHLLLGHRILHKHQMRQPRKPAEDIQISQLSQTIRCEHKVPKVRDLRRHTRLDKGNAVACEQESVDAWREWKVSEDLDVVVGEVEGIMGLFY